MLEIFTDGSCLGNPGPGGYGALLKYKGHERCLSAGYRRTTNNRMEMMAVIAALEALTKSKQSIILTVDSQYVKRGVQEWLQGWKLANWRKKNGALVLNKDLWLRLEASLSNHSVQWRWIKGHQGHIENTRCDELAQSAAKSPTCIDEVYEQLEHAKQASLLF